MVRSAERHPGERLDDQGRKARLRAFWQRWGQLITGVWLIVVSLSILAVALVVRNEQSARDASSRVQCERTMLFGPPLADYLEREGVLSIELARKYRETIPSRCP